VTDCLFCRIAAGEIPAEFVYQDEDVVAFPDINPQAPVHVLVIPRRHVPDLTAAAGADAPLLSKLGAAAARVAVSQGIADSGYRSVINTGPNAQQSVHHLHVHVIGGRELGWPPG
jgi:histidine triad (HIT) family protein